MSPDQIQGTYRPELFGYQDVFVGLGGTVGSGGTYGTLTQGGQPPGHVSEIGFVADWEGGGS